MSEFAQMVKDKARCENGLQNVVECATIVVDMTTKIITGPSALLFSDSFRRFLGLLFLLRKVLLNNGGDRFC